MLAQRYLPLNHKEGAILGKTFFSKTMNWFFFQVDDQTEEPIGTDQVPPSSDDAPAKQKQTKKERRKKERVDSAAYSISVPDKFKGYEIFYDAPDDPDFEPVVTGKVNSFMHHLF